MYGRKTWIKSQKSGFLGCCFVAVWISGKSFNPAEPQSHKNAAGKYLSDITGRLSETLYMKALCKLWYIMKM